MIQTVLSVYKSCCSPLNAVYCGRVQVAMCNYVCEFPLVSALIDIPRFYKHFQKAPEAVYKLAQTHALNIVSLKMPKVRNVVYLKTGLAASLRAITF